MAAQTGTAMMRGKLALVGAIAGFCVWFLFERLEELIVNPWLLLLVSTFTLVFFAVLLVTAGPLGMGRAALAGLAVAVPLALLLTWASLRFDTPGAFLRTGHPVLVALILSFVPLPFLIAALRGTQGWAHYPTLFGQSWGIVVSTTSAWLFAGLVWLVIYLSDALLALVGVHVIEWLLEIEPVAFVMTGFVLGLALAVLDELSDFVSPYLVLRLLRLLLPVVLVVIAIFVLVLPLRGFEQLFEGFSVAGTLLAMAAAALTLVSTAIDRSDDEAVETPLMRTAARLLTLLLPVIALLAGYAVWLRVDQYGWTPDRLALATGVVVVLGYAMLYAASVVLDWHGWMARLRIANTGMALVVIGVAALWLTPVLDPQRISAANQLSRFLDGRTPAADLDIAAISSWGRAGQAAYAELLVLAEEPEQIALRERIAQTEADLPYGRPLPVDSREALEAEVAALLRVTPGGELLHRRILGNAADVDLLRWREACLRRTRMGSPGCYLATGDFLPDEPGQEALLLSRTSYETLDQEAFTHGRGGRLERGAGLLLGGGGVILGQEVETMLDHLALGDYSIAPVSRNGLRLGDKEIVILP